MRSPCSSALLLPSLALTLAASSNLFFATASWGQLSPASLEQGEVLYYGWQSEATDLSAAPPNEVPTAETLVAETLVVETPAAETPAVEESFEPQSAQVLEPAIAQPSPNQPSQAEESIDPGVLTQTQPAAGEAAPADSAAVISAIQVRFLDREGQPTEGTTRPHIITREFDLKPGDVYSQELAQQGLDRVSKLDIIKQASLSLEPAADPGQVVMVISVVERSSFAASLGTNIPLPSALQGPIRPNLVGPGPTEDIGVGLGGTLQLRNVGGNDQNLALRVLGGERAFDTELSFTDPWIAGDPNRTGYTVNVFNQRSVQRVFTGGDRDVDLPNGLTPWVQRIGGGVEFFRPLTSDLTVALGASYQQVSVRNSAFGSVTHAEDERGNAVTVSDTGLDDLLTLSFAGDFDRLNDSKNPTQGYRVLFGVDQAIPIGDANIAFTRLNANYVHYIPLPLFGFARGPRTLVLNLQGGTMLGDVPPYEAFNLDSDAVQGFGGIELGTGSSFFLAAAEYRFPIANFSVFRQPINLGAGIFAGYVTDLGTANDVIGDPAESRRKPGNGIAYGFGLRFGTPIGLLRVELGFNDQGDSEVVVTTGSRF